MRTGPTVLVAAGLVLGLTSTASACMGCSTHQLVCVPGLWLIGGQVGLVIAILAAFIERPYITRSIVEPLPLRHPISRSLQASLISTVLVGTAGIGYMGFAWAGPVGLEILWLPLSVAAATWIERWWLQWRTGMQFRYGWLLLGNITSAMIVATLPFLQMAFGTDAPAYIRMIRPYQGTIAWTTLIAAAIVFTAAVRWTRKDQPLPRREPEEHDFEVIPLPAR